MVAWGGAGNIDAVCIKKGDAADGIASVYEVGARSAVMRQGIKIGRGSANGLQ